MEQEAGNGWADGVDPEDLDRCFAIYSSSFDARRTFQMEYRIRRADGAYRWVLDNGIPNFEAGHVFAGYIGSCIDITDVKRMQEEAMPRQKLETWASWQAASLTISITSWEAFFPRQNWHFPKWRRMHLPSRSFRTSAPWRSAVPK
jgi:hypothetical protein